MFPPAAIAGILTLVLGFIEVDTDSLARPELGSWGVRRFSGISLPECFGSELH